MKTANIIEATSGVINVLKQNFLSMADARFRLVSVYNRAKYTVALECHCKVHLYYGQFSVKKITVMYIVLFYGHSTVYFTVFFYSVLL